MKCGERIPKMFYGAEPYTFQRAKELRGDMTVAEQLLWDFLGTRPNGYKFRRQHPLGNFITDFFCFKLRLVIEVDGGIHDIDEQQLLDQKRQLQIESNGIRVLRIRNDDIINHFECVVEKILDFIKTIT